MDPVGAVLVDFDGTACLHDVAEHLIGFSDPSWPDYDVAVIKSVRITHGSSTNPTQHLEDTL